MWAGSGHAPDLLRRAEAILAQAGGRRDIEAAALKGLAGLRAMRGEFDVARDLMARHRAILQEIGRRLVLGGSAQMAAFVEMLAGDARAAERELRRGREILSQAGDRAYLPAVVALLADALAVQGRHQEAEEALDEAEAIAADGDIETQFRLHTTRGRLLLAQGRADDAEHQARAAVGLMADTDEVDLQAEGQVLLAGKLRTEGRSGPAAVALEAALRLCEEKGNLVASERVRASLVALRPHSTAGPQA